MPTCDQTSGCLSPLTQALYDNHTRSLYDKVGWADTECALPNPLCCEVEVIDETQLKIDGILYMSTINGEWVDLKEVGVPGEIYMGRACIMPLLSWEQMIAMYNESQSVFKIETNG